MASEVVMYCDSCGMYGTPGLGHGTVCGNCRSKQTTTYLPVARYADARHGIVAALHFLEGHVDPLRLDCCDELRAKYEEAVAGLRAAATALSVVAALTEHERADEDRGGADPRELCRGRLL